MGEIGEATVSKFVSWPEVNFRNLHQSYLDQSHLKHEGSHLTNILPTYIQYIPKLNARKGKLKGKEG